MHRAKLIVKREPPFHGADFVTAVARFWPRGAPGGPRRPPTRTLDSLLTLAQVRFWDGQLIKGVLLGAAAHSQTVLHRRVEFLDASQEVDGQLS